MSSVVVLVVRFGSSNFFLELYFALVLFAQARRYIPRFYYKCKLLQRFYTLTLVEYSVRVILFCFLLLHCGLSSTA